MSEDKITPAEAIDAVRKTIHKAMGHLKRRGAVDQALLDLLLPIVDYAHAKVKDHTQCGAGASILMAVGRDISNIAAAISAFEDHVLDDHEVSPMKLDGSPSSSPELVTDRKDNVIHVDLSKGRKN